ncbi:MAG: LacI family DNA-binding transcriptional regulator [Eubacteriales bacterium]|nr:LacI family DNA-binding transcriptional regulator [Eubacteriales bacterium]
MPDIRPTLKTIAQAVGVTANTVSLALRDSPLVAPATKERIREEARAQGYVHNVLAASLRSGRSRTVALAFGDIGNPLFAQKTKRLEAALRARGYQVMILNTNEDPAQEEAVLRLAIQRKADGVILCPCQQGREGPDLLRRHGVPCLLLGRQFSALQEDTLVWEDEQGGYLATRYLLQRGCRRIVYLSAPRCISSAWLRGQGYARALAQAGVAYDAALVRELSPMGRDAAAVLKTLDGGFDGVFAFNDLLAWESAGALPAGFPLVGFDHIAAALNVPFALPSVAADMEAEAQQAVALLLARIEQPDAPVTLHTLPVHLALPHVR